MINFLSSFSLLWFCNEFDWLLVILGLLCFFIFIVLLISTIFESVEKVGNNEIKISKDIEEKQFDEKSGE